MKSPLLFSLLAAASASAAAADSPPPQQQHTKLILQLPPNLPLAPATASQLTARLHSPSGPICFGSSGANDGAATARRASRLAAPLTAAHQFHFWIPACGAAPSPPSSSSSSSSSSASFLLQLDAVDFFADPLRLDLEEGPGGAVLARAHRTVPGNAWDERGSAVAGVTVDGVVQAQGGTEGEGEGEEKKKEEEGEEEQKVEERERVLVVPGDGAARSTIVVPVQAGKRKEYYAEKGFGMAGYLKNPMILMAVGSLVMMFGLPKLMDIFMPEFQEEMAEFKKNRREGMNFRDASNAVADKFDGPASSTTTGTDSAAATKKAKRRNKQ